MARQLQLLFCPAQKRVNDNRKAVLAQGSWPGRSGDRVSGWSSLSSGCYRDPVTYSGMLQAGAWDRANFDTTGSGIYARLRKSGFTLTSATWDEWTGSISTDYWLRQNDSGAAEAIITTTTWAKNRGMHVSGFISNIGETFEVLRCGYSNTANDTTGLYFKFWSDGIVEIYKGNAKVGEGSLRGGRDRDAPRTVISQDWEGITILPFRRREILFFTDKGGGFTFVFDDIDEDDADPIITPATKFWVYAPTKIKFRVVPLAYPTSGTLISQTLCFGQAPPADQPEADMVGWYDFAFSGTETAPVATLVETDGTTPFVADGSLKECRISTLLTGDGTNPGAFMYGILAGFGVTEELTDDSEMVDLLEYAESVRLDVPEDPSGISLAFTMRASADIGIANVQTVGNRPVQLVYADSVTGVVEFVIFEGRLVNPPRKNEGFHDGASLLEFEVSAWKGLEQYLFPDVRPLDGEDLLDMDDPEGSRGAFDLFLRHARLGLHDDCSDLDFSFPEAFGGFAGEWNLAVEVGDTPAQWISRLKDDYAAQCRATLRPTNDGTSPAYWIKTPEDIDAQTVAKTLYGAREDSGDVNDADELVFRSYEEEILEPESNDIRTTGWDPRAQRPIQSHKANYPSQDPTTPPSSQDDDWLGDPRLYGLVETAITTQAMCDEVCIRLYDRLCVPRRLAEIECEWQLDDTGFPVWVGDLLELDGRGVWMVNSLSVDFDKVDRDDTWKSQPAIYTLEYRPDVTA